MPTTSLWQETVSRPKFPALDKDLTVDVAVVGGGNTGVVAAYLMKRAGLKVALLEKQSIGGGDTGHTSAHLTYVTDWRISQLVKKLGRDHAAAVWEAGDAAIHEIETIRQKEAIQCDFARIPGFLISALIDEKDETADLRVEAQLAQDLGFDASFVNSTPHFDKPGIRFVNQARFHPLKFMAGLLNVIPGNGCHVFEHSEVEEITGDPITVKANGHTINAGKVFIATDVPLQGKTGLVSATLFQTKFMPYSSYVIGARVSKGSVADALIWDTYDPYHFFRLFPGDTSDFVIFGGADHKTGQDDDPRPRFEQLEKLLLKYFPQAQFEKRWSGQVIEAVDGLPYIGETATNQFVATGFSGNGLTFGTLSAMMASDWVQGKTNPWADLFSPNRKKLGALWNYLKENIDYPYYMVKDRLKKSDEAGPGSVPKGEGRILNINGQRRAVFHANDGTITSMSALCTHMGCVVHFNAAEKTWDCPCHGSRFHSTGKLLAGPAETDLVSERISLEVKG